MKYADKKDLPLVEMTGDDVEADSISRAVCRERRACDFEYRQRAGELLSEEEAAFLLEWRTTYPRFT